jgi:hypothetical protein
VSLLSRESTFFGTTLISRMRLTNVSRHIPQRAARIAQDACPALNVPYDLRQQSLGNFLAPHAGIASGFGLRAGLNENAGGARLFSRGIAGAIVERTQTLAVQPHAVKDYFPELIGAAKYRRQSSGASSACSATSAIAHWRGTSLPAERFGSSAVAPARRACDPPQGTT